MNIYEELLSNFDIKKGDSIWLSSELLRFILFFKKKGIEFDGNTLIDTLQNKLGSEGTILIPTFSFDFCNKNYYDVLNTKCSTGALGNLALQRDDFSRTQHPMHSFAVWGKDKDYLISMQNKHSFGLDSPFAYCIGNHIMQIILGTDYVHAMTFIHYAEVVCNVPYRFAKSFTGDYIAKTGEVEKRTYDYAARKLEIKPEECFNKMGLILEESGCAQKIEIAGCNNYEIDLAKSFPLICNDIIQNQCSNIYDFNVSREQVFKTLKNDRR